MTTSRRLARLPLLLIGLAALAALVLIPLIVHAQSQEVTATAAATGANPPAKPTNLLASAAHDSVTLTWTPSTDQTVTHYAILRRNPGTDASQVFHVIESNAGPETSYSDGTVSASTTYIYRVKSVSPTGVSQWSGYVKAETPAAPDSTLEPTPTPTPTPTATPTPEPVSTPTPEDLRPTGLTVSLVDNKVSLSWTAPAEDAESVDGYEILRRRPMEGESTLATLVADTESTATTYTDATANEAGVRYVYRVKALRGDDVSLWSNFDKIDLPADYVPDPTPTPEPESTSDDQAPTGLSAALADGGGVALSWTAPSEDADSVTGYEILRAVGEGEMASLAADTGNTATAYTDATATDAGETYAYQVKAIRGADRSEASGQTQVQLPHDPVDLSPTGLTALTLFVSLEGNISYSVHLSWTAPAEDVDSITGYEILRAVGEGALATLVDDTGNTATSYNDASATQTGETYAYTVKAIRGEDRSQASGQAQAQIPHDPVDLAPSDLTAEAVDGGGVSLSWSAPAEDADSVTGYEVLRAVGDGEMATLAADTASTTTTYSDATATEEGETYAYRVKAIRGQARSQASNRVALIPVEPPATPENLKPTNLTFEIREDGVTLAWDVPAAAADSVTGYRVVRRRPNQGENEWLVWKWDTGSTETTYKDGYAQTHGEYYMYRVRALRGDDYSKMSNRVDVRRPETTPQTAEWAPSNLQAQMYFEVALGEEGVTTQVKLTWDAPAEGVEWVRGYEVQRATCDDDFAALVADTGSTDTAYADATAEAGESYTYRVRARRPQGLSLTSNTWTLLLPGGNGESDCAVPLGAPETEPVEEEEDLTYALSTHETEVVLVKNTGQTAESAGLALDATVTIRGQAFTTGAHTDGYVLRSVGVDFHTIANTSTARAQVSVTLTTDYRGNLRGLTLCALRDPSSFTGSGVQRFDAPTNVPCPRLTPNTSYYVLIERVTNTSDAISLSSTLSNDEEIGQIANKSRYLEGSRDFIPDPGSNALQIVVYGNEIRSAVRLPTQDFITLAAGNDRPNGLWSDGTTMWVSQRRNPNNNSGGPPKIFAYDMATKAHKPTEDFDTLDAVGNDTPVGIWSDGTTMFVLDEPDRKIYAYDMATKQRDRDKEVWGRLPRFSQDLWSDGDNMWVAKCCGPSSHGVLAYLFDADLRVEDKDIRSTVLHDNLNNQPFGIWADETTMFVSDINDGIVYAYWKTWGVPQPGRNIQLNPLQRGADDGWGPRGIWSDGFTMWVADRSTDAIYAYTLPPPESPLGFQRRVSVESATDTTAIVAVDLRSLPFGGQRQAVKMSILYGGHTIYAHPDAEEARFMLRGLEPESPYTVNVRFGSSPGVRLGAAQFRTDYARLDKIEASGLTHSEVTLKVSLAGTDVNKRAYPNYWVSRDRTDPEHTFYLRHRASDETDWSEPVELTFADLVAEARLINLEPGTDYDVELAPDEDFAPPSTSVASYSGTLTVGEDDGFGFVGYDGVGSFGDPYGSLTQTTFTVGGVVRSINYLQTHPFGGAGLDQQALLLEFDAALPAAVGELQTDFTLTVGTTVYNSADARRTGEAGYEWSNPPTWSENDEVTVQIRFTEALPFKEGTTLLVEGAFTTPPLPQTLAFDVDMTVGLDTANSFAGYKTLTGSLSATTFEVGGVEYTVKQAGVLTAAPANWAFQVDPALPFDSFTVTIGSTELQSSNATTADSTSGRQYIWSATDPNWASGATVDVKLDIGLIDICDRSPAVAHAIREATPSFDFCHMTSVLDLDDLTELRIPNGRGAGLKAGDFEGLSGLTRLDLSHYILSLQQLPVGVFDGLDSLESLDLSHTDLLKLDLGVFDGLDDLVELDLSDTSLGRSGVPVGVFDPLSGSLEVLRLSNESSIGGYRTTFSNIGDDFFQGLGNLEFLDLGASNPLRDSPRSLLPLTALETYNGQAYTRPADPPANFDYASGRIDHELGYHRTCYAVTLKWDAPAGVSGITGYRILRNLGAESLSRYAKQIATTGASARTFIDGRDADVCFGGVGSGPNVSYFVSAIIGNKDSFPARVRVDQTQAFPTSQVPSRPTLSDSLYDLSVAKSPNGYKVRLRWNSTHHNITGYEISFRGSSTAAWQTIVVNAGNVLKYDLESIPILPSSVPRTAENMYLYNAFRDQGESIGFTDGREFRIRALNAAGNSGWSNVVRPFR